MDKSKLLAMFTDVSAALCGEYHEHHSVSSDETLEFEAEHAARVKAFKEEMEKE